MPFRTILIVDLTSDAHFIKEQLEFEGITVRLLDEDNPDLNYEYSPELGVKIQVLESDVAKARIILIQSGHINILDTPSSTLEDIYTLTEKISFMKNWGFLTRLSVLAIIASAIIILLVFSMYYLFY